MWCASCAPSPRPKPGRVPGLPVMRALMRPTTEDHDDDESKTGTADDLIKAYCREQLGASAAAARNWSAYLSIDADVSAGQAVVMNGHAA